MSDDAPDTLAERALAWFQGWDEAREQGSLLHAGAVSLAAASS